MNIVIDRIEQTKKRNYFFFLELNFATLGDLCSPFTLAFIAVLVRKFAFGVSSNLTGDGRWGGGNNRGTDRTGAPKDECDIGVDGVKEESTGGGGDK